MEEGRSDSIMAASEAAQATEAREVQAEVEEGNALQSKRMRSAALHIAETEFVSSTLSASDGRSDAARPTSVALEEGVVTTSSSDCVDSPAARSLSMSHTKRRQWQCWGCLAVCAVVLALALAGVVCFYSIRDTSWKLVKVGFERKALNSFLGVVESNASNTTARLTMQASVELWNPNFVPAVVEPSLGIVQTGGVYVAESQTHLFNLAARGSGIVASDITVSLSATDGKRLLDDAFAHQGFIKVHAVGTVEAFVYSWIPLRCLVTCEITTNIFNLLRNNPETVIVGKDCRYDDCWKL